MREATLREVRMLERKGFISYYGRHGESFIVDPTDRFGLGSLRRRNKRFVTQYKDGCFLPFLKVIED